LDKSKFKATFCVKKVLDEVKGDLEKWKTEVQNKSEVQNRTKVDP
jgi:gas vesicle protein